MTTSTLTSGATVEIEVSTGQRGPVLKFEIGRPQGMPGFVGEWILFDGNQACEDFDADSLPDDLTEDELHELMMALDAAIWG